MNSQQLARFILVALAGLLCITVARGEDSNASLSGPGVIGFERFAAGSKEAGVNVLGGRLLLNELNCVACHVPGGSVPSAPLAAKQAPVLTRVSARVQPDYLRHFIADPQAVKPASTMPSLFAGLDATERARRVEAIVHYLASLGEAPRQEFPIVGAGKRGRALFHQVGCVACHGARDPGAQRGDEVLLGLLSKKYTLPSLSTFLEDPLHVRPSGRMPDFKLTREEARDVAAYLLELPEVARLRYDYYEGPWDSLPDFRALQPVASGGAEQFDVKLAPRKENFALRFEGFLHLDADGEYTFHLGSDDGSRLLIDGVEVIGNDGIHSFTTKHAKRRLEKGTRHVVVEYFERGGEEQLAVEFEGPALLRRSLADHMTAERVQPDSEGAVLGIDIRADLVAEGRRWFTSSGCASCHLLEENGVRVPAPPLARHLEQLRPNHGCLNPSVPTTAPNYRLRDDQRQAIRAALEQQPASPPDSAETSLAFTFQTFNCYACHERDEQGGVQPEHNAWFQTTVPEMGDEGRIPPRLTGIGGKLTTQWLEQLLAHGAKDRPYMQTKMPSFGAVNVGHLVKVFAQVDELPPAEPITFTEPLAKVKEIGRKLVGETGLSCIKCHTFGHFRSQGIQSINMRPMTERLREEWFRPYLRNPQLFRPGTRMPAAWPPSGKSFFTEYFDGDTDRQIAAIWLYLRDGERAKIPAGLVTPAMELVPVDHAIIYRNFILGAGPRGIAVGYPEGVHQAFDAEHLRLALLWKGRFIDASRHWSGRSEGFQGPAGDSILSLPEGPAFARLESAVTSWPAASTGAPDYRFRGYHVDDESRPTFLYTAAGLAVEDHLDTNGLGAADPVQRRVRISAPRVGESNSTGIVYFRAAAAANVEREDDGWYRIDATWRVRIRPMPDSEPVLRSSDGPMDLLVPIRLSGEQAELHLEYAW